MTRSYDDDELRADAAFVTAIADAAADAVREGAVRKGTARDGAEREGVVRDGGAR